jgi:hypothetical protein
MAAAVVAVLAQLVAMQVQTKQEPTVVLALHHLFQVHL